MINYRVVRCLIFQPQMTRMTQIFKLRTQRHGDTEFLFYPSYKYTSLCVFVPEVFE